MSIAAAPSTSKLATGIDGFDRLSGGGVPEGRTTLLVGGPGTGKTVFALNTLANRLRDAGESGIFVTFEEDADTLIANAASFGWTLSSGGAAEGGPGIFVLDAKLSPDIAQSGDFDLNGLIGALTALKQRTGARIIVLDSIDWLLAMLDSGAARRRELLRLRQWLRQEGATALLTAKTDQPLEGDAESALAYLPYMTECVVVLHHEVSRRVARRWIRLLKYRGAAHNSNASPLLIRSNGIMVMADKVDMSWPASMERVASGVERLDTMLKGGYYRSSTVLVSGAPGTAKSTLGGAFVDAACRRGERALFYSFDEPAAQIVRNLRSVNIDLGAHVDSGLLSILTSRASASSMEEQFAALRDAVELHKPHAVVIDPISAIGKINEETESSAIIVQMLDYMKARGITVLATALLHPLHRDTEGTQYHISTIADTWMDVSFRIAKGERNRALTIVKSRGMAHSNQVRELVLSSDGLTLADVYASGGDVLMGTARMEHEAEDRVHEALHQAEHTHRHKELENLEQRLALQLQMLQAEISQARNERERILLEENIRRKERSDARTHVRMMRRADDTGTRETETQS